MAYSVPPISHPAREMFDMHDLVLIGTGERLPLDFAAALRCARQTFAKCAADRIKPRRLLYIALRADDSLQLVSIGPRGGHRVEWTFGRYVVPPVTRCRCGITVFASSDNRTGECTACMKKDR